MKHNFQLFNDVIAINLAHTDRNTYKFIIINLSHTARDGSW